VNILLGFGVSLLIKNEVIALDVAIFYNSPAFIFSGFTFPIWAMPWLNSMYAQLNPYTHFLTGFLKIYQLDTPLYFIGTEVSKLTIFFMIALLMIGGGLIVNRKEIFISKKRSVI
ncbi:MAG: ABC transporter permease, partial [Oceanihabitans sp.]|nr:ABC transporter permease [Oceanihabitans sp.]